MVRIEKFFFLKWSTKSETNKYNKKSKIFYAKKIFFWFFSPKMVNFWNFSKNLNFFWIFKIFLAPACFKSVQSHHKNSFYQKKITDAAMKNYRKITKFLSNFWIFGQNFQFFGPKFFSWILYPKTFLCAKNQDCTLKTWFVINFYRFWSKIAINCPNLADTLILDPLATPPYGSELSRKNFIGSQNDS